MPPRYEGGMTFSGVPGAPKPPENDRPRGPGGVGGPPDTVPRMKWLAECSPAALREALRVVAPELSRYPVTVPGPVGKQDPVWHSG
jgi:hypothetical protein